MKYLALLLLFALNIPHGCSQAANTGPEIKYTAQTRGFTYMIHVLNDTLTYSNSLDDISNKQITLSTEQKDRLNDILKAIDLNVVPTLDRPSTGSFTDRLPQAQLEINMDQKTSVRSPEFDHGKPPLIIKNLINYLQQLARQ